MARRASLSDNVSDNSRKSFRIIFWSWWDKRWLTDVKSARMAKHRASKLLISLEAFFNTHRQSTQHDSNQANSYVSHVNHVFRIDYSYPPVLVPAIYSK